MAQRPLDQSRPARWLMTPAALAPCAAAVLALCVAAALAPGAAAAQEAEQGRATLATLPQSNEALVLTSRVEQAVQVGDWRLAIELIEQIAGLSESLVAAPASRTYYPVWRHGLLLYAQLPPEAVQLYQQLYDGEVEALFEQASAEGDLEALRELFRRHRLASAWPRIGDELVARLLDEGQYGAVIETLREMQWSGEPLDAPRQAQMVAALAQAGAARAARDALKALDAPEPDAGAAGAARLDELRGWLSQRTLGAPGGGVDYLLGRGPVWVSRVGAGGASPAEELADAVDRLQRLPLIAPVLADDTLIYRQGGRIHAFDALTLTPRWAAGELRPDSTGLAAGGEMAAGLDDRDAPLSLETQLLLANPLRHAVGAGGGLVYTIERLTLYSSGEVLRQPFAVEEQSLVTNELVARDLSTGKIVWQSGGDPTGPLAEVEFQDRPLVDGDRLLAPIRRGQQVRVAELDAGTGELRREIPVLGPPIHFTREGGRFLISADETSVYLTTGNGVIAALRRGDLSWQWATVYPSTVAEHLGRLWWKPPVEPQEFGVTRPVLADELLILAPPDSLEIFALDRFSGRERWRMERREFTDLVGAVSAGLVVAGNGITCLDLRDPEGAPPRWRTLPLEIVGRGVIHRDRVYVPTRQGVVVIDGATGKVVDDQWAAQGARPADCAPFNLVASDAGLFAVSPEQVTKYPAPEATETACAALLEREPDAVRPRLALGWLAAVRGDYTAARRQLESLGGLDAAQAASRDALLRHTYLALAEQTSGPAEQLEWLRRAAALATGSPAAAELSLRIAEALEARGDVAEAVAQYCGLFEPAGEALIDAEAELRQAAWLRAAGRLRDMQRAAPAGFDEAVRAFVQQQPANHALLRLLQALAPGPLRDEVACELLVRPIAPELKLAFIDASTAGLDDERARRCELARWEALVATDRLEEAARVGRAWRERFGQDPESLPQDQRELLDAVELAERKLRAAEAEPFGEQIWRQWVLEQAELLQDGDEPVDPELRWLLVRNLGTREIQLIDALQYQGYPRRKTPDALLSDAPPAAALWQADPRQLIFGQGGHDWQATARRAWPMRRQGMLAAVPVPGGLVGVGLGPERGGGQRLWERAVPEWSSPPPEFHDKSACNAGGLFTSTRPGRIECLDWADGQVKWRRDLPGAAVERLWLAGEWLIAWTGEQRVWSMRAADGDRLSALPGEISPRAAAVCGDRLVVLTDGALLGFRPAAEGFEPLWSLACRGGALWSGPAGRAGGLAAAAADAAPGGGDPAGWVFVREVEQPAWFAVDVRSGRRVGDWSVGPFAELTAVWEEAQRLLVSGTLPAAVGAGGAGLGAWDAGGVRAWYQPFQGGRPPSTPDLAAHPHFVPVFATEVGAGPAGRAAPQVTLVRKADGARLAPRSLEGDYDRGLTATGLQAATTRARIIVQVDGNVIAYGNSLLRRNP